MSESELTRYCERHEDTIAFARLSSPSAAGTPLVEDLCHRCLRTKLEGFEMMGVPGRVEMTVFVDAPEVVDAGERLGLDVSVVDDPVAVDVENPLENPRQDLINRTLELSEDVGGVCEDDRLTDTEVGQLRAARNVLLDVRASLQDRMAQDQKVLADSPREDSDE